MLHVLLGPHAQAVRTTLQAHFQLQDPWSELRKDAWQLMVTARDWMPELPSSSRSGQEDGAWPLSPGMCLNKVKDSMHIEACRQCWLLHIV